MEQYALLIAATLNAGTVLAIAALGLLINEKSGIVNLGAEGMMLCAAIAGFATVVHTGNDWLGFAAGMGVEIWLEVHGRDTQNPPVCADIMKATRHPQVGLCWNSNPPDVVNGSVKQSFDLLRPYIKNVHINELAGPYPYRELFALLQASGYDRYTLCEAQESKEPERFLRWYRALWTELNRKCA